MTHDGMTLAKRFLKPKSYIFILRLIPLLINLKCTKANNNSHRSVSDIESGVKLEELLQKHGSDKATMHDYWRVYEKVFAASQDGRGIILEVGMGTNNPLIPSNMGGYFTPGGSLRAWQAYFSNFEILGADIDREILFAEGRIKTFWLDQIKRETFSDLHVYLKSKSLDFVIIDGLHQPFADLNTLVELLPYLKKGGHIFVEDIEPSHSIKLFWKLVRLLLPEGYSGILLRQKGGLIFDLQRRT
jgi:hypothetical protein